MRTYFMFYSINIENAKEYGRIFDENAGTLKKLRKTAQEEVEKVYVLQIF